MTIHFKWLKNYQTYYVAFTPWRITGRQMAVYLFKKNIFSPQMAPHIILRNMLRMNAPFKSKLMIQF